MEQTELKYVLKYLLKEVEADNIATIDELINIATELIEKRILVFEN